ncbi:hypothetical protein C8R21_10962 [Nitrosospira multiformis]|uniref:Uncharacterized protein n=1 Tax=Nitrosospira multiformis TaxID=1231 RepID=A0A2T5ICM3_9PROT|nr:hypothetical protein [Nitrosospira multiformis]PTQ81511.1 hypothetical protein C8R21_10962 [Nitrosospira multiformis]
MQFEAALRFPPFSKNIFRYIDATGDMMTIENKSPSKRIECEETGILTERADLPNSKPGAKDKAEHQPLLPHERDETTRPTGTSHRGNEHTREVIGQAHEDTKQGLKDTDRRGIPSDIVHSDIPAADDIPGVSPDRNVKKH